MREFTIKKESQLLPFLNEVLGKKAKNELRHGNVRVNGEVITRHDHALKPGDRVSVGRQALSFPILYEDKDIIVIDKPAGLLTERTARMKDKTAYMMVKEYLARKREKIYLPHRLDRETSGVLMFLKNKALYEELTHHWNERVTERSYIALVEGRTDQKGRIDTPLLETKSQQVIVHPKGKKAITLYETIRQGKDYSLVHLNLLTGRRHQIRAHMASIGHPVAGDRVHDAKTNPCHRLCLHHQALSVTIHGKTMRFVSQAPSEWARKVH